MYINQIVLATVIYIFLLIVRVYYKIDLIFCYENMIAS